MADIALLASTASTHSGNTDVRLSVEESIEQGTYVAGADLTAGCPVQIDTAGKLAVCDASAAGTAKPLGITVKAVKSGYPVTVISKGVLGGFDFGSQNFGTDIYLSTTSGILADAAPGGQNDVTVKIGSIVPHYGVRRGNTFIKLLRVNL